MRYRWYYHYVKSFRRKEESGLGNRIKERREFLRMSQEDLSAKSGISRQTISSLGNTPGKNVSTKTLEKLAAALEVTVGELFFADNV